MHVAEGCALALMAKESVTIHFIHCHNTIKKMLKQIKGITNQIVVTTSWRCQFRAAPHRVGTHSLEREGMIRLISSSISS